MRAAAALALLLAGAAPALAQAPSPQEVVAACISLTEAALEGASGARREALAADLDLMHKALEGLNLLGTSAAEMAPPVARLPTRLAECSDAG
ncbi:hypothetical protein [Oceanicola sp. 502str15]|uniref:hypothetical protein n=1 Tax=Oceanicola sp. 502str15 TaxID=2696061 RepID=UPI002095618D|nr:hypothetical protein [Oceanicola sp. 502str15]MCO6382551.1 hypothetical protein [Oceanicola sp. 502str15]